MNEQKWLTALAAEEEPPHPDYREMWERIEKRLASTGMRNRRHGPVGIWRRVQYASLGIVGALVLVVAVGVYVSPTLAAYLKSFFDRSTVDPGLQEAAKKGYSQALQTSVTDQGLTVKVLEVLADSSRVVITVGAEKDGKPIDASQLLNTDFFYKESWKKGLFLIKDAEGNIVADKVSDWYPHAPFTDLAFTLKNKPVSQQLTAQLIIKKLGDAVGDWRLEVPVDLKKADSATVVVPLEKRYVLNQGIVVNVKRIVHAPTTSSVEVETEWTPEAKERVMREVNFPAILGVDFHIEDEQGEVVATSKHNEGRKSPIAILGDSYVYRGMNQSFTYRFAPMDPTKSYTFVLDGVRVSEPPHAIVEFDPGD